MRCNNAYGLPFDPRTAKLASIENSISYCLRFLKSCECSLEANYWRRQGDQQGSANSQSNSGYSEVSSTENRRKNLSHHRLPRCRLQEQSRQEFTERPVHFPGRRTNPLTRLNGFSCRLRVTEDQEDHSLNNGLRALLIHEVLRNLSVPQRPMDGHQWRSI